MNMRSIKHFFAYTSILLLLNTVLIIYYYLNANNHDNKIAKEYITSIIHSLKDNLSKKYISDIKLISYNEKCNDINNITTWENANLGIWYGFNSGCICSNINNNTNIKDYSKDVKFITSIENCKSFNKHIKSIEEKSLFVNELKLSNIYTSCTDIPYVNSVNITSFKGINLCIKKEKYNFIDLFNNYINNFLNNTDFNSNKSKEKLLLNSNKNTNNNLKINYNDFNKYVLKKINKNSIIDIKIIDNNLINYLNEKYNNSNINSHNYYDIINLNTSKYKSTNYFNKNSLFSKDSFNYNITENLLFDLNYYFNNYKNVTILTKSIENIDLSNEKSITDKLISSINLQNKYLHSFDYFLDKNNVMINYYKNSIKELYENKSNYHLIKDSYIFKKNNIINLDYNILNQNKLSYNLDTNSKLKNVNNIHFMSDPFDIFNFNGRITEIYNSLLYRIYNKSYFDKMNKDNSNENYNYSNYNNLYNEFFNRNRINHNNYSPIVNSNIENNLVYENYFSIFDLMICMNTINTNNNYFNNLINFDLKTEIDNVDKLVNKILNLKTDKIITSFIIVLFIFIFELLFLLYSKIFLKKIIIIYFLLALLLFLNIVYSVLILLILIDNTSNYYYFNNVILFNYDNCFKSFFKSNININTTKYFMYSNYIIILIIYTISILVSLFLNLIRIAFFFKKSSRDNIISYFKEYKSSNLKNNTIKRQKTKSYIKNINVVYDNVNNEISNNISKNISNNMVKNKKSISSTFNTVVNQ